MAKVEAKYLGLTLEESKALSLKEPSEAYSWIVKESHDRSVSEGFLWYSAILHLHFELQKTKDV